MEPEVNGVKVKYEIMDNDEALLEENIVKQEKDIPEYVNINTFSNVKVKTETSENVQEIFQCSHCPSKYKKNAYLTIHEALHDPRRFCPVCYETFTCKKKLRDHLNQHIKDQIKEDKKLAFSCRYCGKSFDTRKNFILHERVHTNERPHKCEICGEGFKQSGTLKDHYVTHTKEKRFVCEICNGSFTTSSSLKRHKRKMHDKGKTINCKHCGAKFLNMADFWAHRNDVHPDTGYKRTCTICMEIFRSRGSYGKHKQYHDDLDQSPKSIKYYLCALCGEKMMTLDLYYEHRRIHLNYTQEELKDATKNRAFKCKFCSQQYVYISALRRHMNIHMKKDYECNLCQNFYTYYGLKIHMRTAHQILHCRVCRKSLTGRGSLYYHYQKWHPTVKKPFPCNICGKQYLQRSRLNLHFKIIHEKKSIKNYKCGICGKRFLTRLIMGSHMASVHKSISRKIKYKCSFCEVVCATKQEMLTHNSIHKESTITFQKYCAEIPSNGGSRKCFQCKLCKKRFQSSKSCKIHLGFGSCRNFLGKRKRQENRCVVCSKKLASEATLRQHMKLHSSFDFTCRFCDKKYKTIGALRSHMRVHHAGKKIFKCESCDEEFDKIYKYSDHKYKHKLEIEPPVHINSYTDSVLDVKYAANEFIVFKEEPDDPSVENLNCE